MFFRQPRRMKPEPGVFVEAELGKDEVFIANTNKPLGDEFKHLKTLRLGKQALDINGVPLSNEHKPMFIHKSELDGYNKVMDAKVRKAKRGY